MTQAIKIKNLNFRYPDGQPALREISLEIGAGEKIGLIGPNGAGKTTLLLQLNGVLPGDFEELEIFGLSLKDKKNLAKIRELVGLVFQDPNDQLFMPTVFEDVALAPLQKGLNGGRLKEAVRQALDEVGLGGEMENKMAHHLSFGEKKKVTLAAIFAQQPEILVLDEPADSLDPRTQRELLGIFKNFSKTMILATHDLNLVKKVCEKVIFLKEGRLVYFGPIFPVIEDTGFLTECGL